MRTHRARSRRRSQRRRRPVASSVLDAPEPPRSGPRARRGKEVLVVRSSSAIVSSTMLKVKIDRQEPTELFEQVAAEIRRAIADGEAKPGERLPPARDLAAVLGVNTNTVLRSLRLLRDEGLLEFR